MSSKKTMPRFAKPTAAALRDVATANAMRAEHSAALVAAIKAGHSLRDAIRLVAEAT